jgi:hypothetical protein
MTAEILVMNKTAVALAADSAVTSGGGKIFNSVNKLFRLSDHQPVGIMIYGNAEIMGLPWESLIKMYKDQRGDGSENSLIEYGRDFVAYIKRQSSLFPDRERTMCVRRSAAGFLSELAAAASQIAAAGAPNLDVEIRNVAQQFGNLIPKIYKKLKDLPVDYLKQMRAKYGKNINQLITEYFETFSISQPTRTVIRNYCLDCLCREYFQNFSGVVIAGFGKTEIFPAYVEYEIEGFPIGNFLRYRQKRQSRIAFDNSAGVVSFAQKEMVQSFMTGIHPYYREHLDAYLRQVLTQYEQAIVKGLGPMSKAKLSQFKIKLNKAGKIILDSLNDSLKTHQDDYHVSPVLDAVEMLPKDELAIMAESLVNLTVLKRRMSTDEESVGGPIDVAVISKGDGFVWIKRKHYFTTDLNPRFLNQYFPIANV